MMSVAFVLHQSRRPILLAALVTSAILVSSCSSASSTSASAARTGGSSASSGVTIAQISGTLTNPWFGAEKNGVDQAGKDLGVTVQFVATNVTGPGMAQAIQAAIAQHVSGIAVHDWFPSAEDPYISKAIAAGIPVIEVDAAGPDWQSNGSLGFIGQTDQQAGLNGAQRLLAAGVRHALFVNHAPGAVNLETRWQAFQPAMKAAGATATQLNIPFSDSTNPAAVTQDIKGALVANPSIDGVFTNGASIAENAVGAVSSAGLSSKIKIGTTDLSTGDLNDVANGSLLFALDSQPYLIGYYAVTALALANRYGMHPIGQISTGPIAITKANVQQVLQENNTSKGIRGAA
jgi:simple sugar transport system substrate-binding protein